VTYEFRRVTLTTTRGSVEKRLWKAVDKKGSVGLHHNSRTVCAVQRSATLFLNNINRLVFVTELHCVFCEVAFEIPYII